MRCINDGSRPCKRRCFETDQNGRGFLSDFKNAIVNKANVLSNLVPDSDANARPLFKGEVHAFLKLKNNKISRANYMGPGTELVKRLKRGDPPRTFSDKESQAHDSRYALATSQADVRRADSKMIDVMRRARRDNLDSSFNTTQGLRLIQAKRKIEDVSGRSLVSFGRVANKDKPLVQAKLSQLEKEGFGANPASRLRKKMLRQKTLTTNAKKNTFRSGNYEALGGGQPGGSPHILNLLSEQLSKLLLPLAKKHIMKKIASAR